jgi:hypothetical protein
MKILVLLGIVGALVVATVLGATKASVSGHPNWYLSRGSAAVIGLVIGMIAVYKEKITFINTKQCFLAVLVALGLSIVALPIINSIDSQYVSNRSYGHIIGTAIIVIFVYSIVILFGKLFQKLKHLTSAST